MTETKHTPGPWKTRKGFFSDAVEIYKPKHLMKPFIPTEIAIIRIEGPEGEANAHLIATAPDLLEALRSIAAITTCADQDHEAMCAEIQGICRVALAALEPGERA